MRRLLATACLLFIVIECKAAEYVGATVCGSCHDTAYQAWQKSHHFRSMLVASEASVLGDFDSTELTVKGVVSRFYRDGDTFLVETTGDTGIEQLKVEYTFGAWPLQQYLVSASNGRMQALNLAWDSRPAESGGQRWFHLRGQIDDGSPFFWSRHLQNWNARCADCHSTGVLKGYDADSGQYNSRFEAVNVACESCHGPGSQHVASIGKGGTPVSMGTLPGGLQWRFEAGGRIAQAAGTPDDGHIRMCGGCHSRRSVIDPSGAGYHEQYRLALLDPGLYEHDGQIRDEVFVLGSFLQSKMHQQGVSCMDCHDAHSGAVKFPDNRLCAQCHAPTVYDTKTHKLHAGGAGSDCVDCHMPARTYMMVDDRRDHSFSVPDPRLTRDFGIPNACNSCHQDRQPAWAIAAIGRTLPAHPFAELNAALDSGDPLLVPPAVNYIRNSDNAAIRRASLLARLPLADQSVRAALEMLRDDSALVRMAAVSLLAAGPAELAQRLLPQLAEDDSVLVRAEAGRGFAPLLPRIDQAQSRLLHGLIDDYRSTLAPTLDFPSTQTALGMLAVSLGQADEAEQHYLEALRIEPDHLPALLNLADLLRARQHTAQAESLIARAVNVAPDSAAASHSYGLFLVRQGRQAEALEWFHKAVNLSDSVPRYAYVHAVALDAQGRTPEAVEALVNASARWPNQYDLLVLEMLYREKANDMSGMSRALDALSKIAAADPRVRAWLSRYPPQ